MQPSPQPGWYPDTSGVPQQRYFDGHEWTPNVAPLAVPPMPTPAGVVTTGPNHALHFVLTLFTWPLCGGWAWVWLFVALANNRQTYTVDMYGNRIVAPRPPRQPGSAPSQIDQLRRWADAEQGRWVWVWLGVGGSVVLFILLLWLVNLGGSR